MATSVIDACDANRALDDRPSLSPHANKLLATLPLEEYRRVFEEVSIVPLKARQPLYRQGQRISDVYFPCSGVCSILKLMQDGAMTEVAAIGNEGMIGSSIYLGDDLSIGDVLVQLDGGDALKMPAGAFIREMERRGAFYDRVIRYSQALAAQLMQMTACNGLHSVEQRCCRWLLMTRDRIGRDDLKITHECLATALGVRRSSITLALGGLQTAGLVETDRAVIRILDRRRLEHVSCECYATLKTSFRRFLPEIV